MGAQWYAINLIRIIGCQPWIEYSTHTFHFRQKAMSAVPYQNRIPVSIYLPNSVKIISSTLTHFPLTWLLQLLLRVISKHLHYGAFQRVVVRAAHLFFLVLAWYISGYNNEPSDHIFNSRCYDFEKFANLLALIFLFFIQFVYSYHCTSNLSVGISPFAQARTKVCKRVCCSQTERSSNETEIMRMTTPTKSCRNTLEFYRFVSKRHFKHQ